MSTVIRVISLIVLCAGGYYFATLLSPVMRDRDMSQLPMLGGLFVVNSVALFGVLRQRAADPLAGHRAYAARRSAQKKARARDAAAANLEHLQFED